MFQRQRVVYLYMYTSAHHSNREVTSRSLILPRTPTCDYQRQKKHTRRKKKKNETNENRVVEHRSLFCAVNKLHRHYHTFDEKNKKKKN